MNVAMENFLLEPLYEPVLGQLKAGWFGAASLFLPTPKNDWSKPNFIEAVNSCFSPIAKGPKRFNPQLTAGIFASLRDRPTSSGRLTRPYLLMLQSFTTASNSEGSRRANRDPSDRYNRPRVMCPSPLAFVKDMLTSPDYLASKEYAKAVIRAEIFQAATEFSETVLKKNSSLTPNERVRQWITLDRLANSLAKASTSLNNNDTFSIVDETDFILGSLLASNGTAFLSFAPGYELYKSEKRYERQVMGVFEFADKEMLIPPPGQTYDFRLSARLSKLPSSAQIINELDGVPLPLPGCDCVFAGGLRTSASRGTIVRLSGPSGSGKTSFALALADSLSPLGIFTCYLSCEEDPADLKNRLASLATSFSARLQRGHRRKKYDWFYATHLDHPDPSQNIIQAQLFVDDMVDLYFRKDINPSVDRPVGLVPLVVIIDGVHELISYASDDPVFRIRKFVEKFRNLGAIVIVMSANHDDPALRELDYIVDVVLRLDHDIKITTADPQRKLVLVKSRLQYSQAGAHDFHIARDNGVRLSPRISSQLDAFAQFLWETPNRRRYFDFLQTAVPVGSMRSEQPLVRIFERSQILIGGHGSSGKAAFALRLLCSNIIDQSTRAEEDIFAASNYDDATTPPRRILIISFLYPDEYYQSIVRKMRGWDNLVDTLSQDSLTDIKLDVLDFYPGYLPPEIFFRKVLDRCRSAALEGLPFDGVLVDGLHNVFLQFPLLETAILMWPSLFDAFRVMGLTVATTHTHFSVHGMEQDSVLYSDVKTANSRVAPLLQAIINSADFYFDVSPRYDVGDVLTYSVKVVSALGQDVVPSDYFWNRQTMHVERRRTKLI